MVVPPYGKRRGYIPRAKEDFGDGGAFPEVHVAQYPLDMGRADKKSTAIVAVNIAGGAKSKVFASATDLVEKQMDAVCCRVVLRGEWRFRYLAGRPVRRRGRRLHHLCFCLRYRLRRHLCVRVPSMLACQASLARPSEDVELETASKTKAALERIVNGKIAAARPVVIPGNASTSAAKDKYIQVWQVVSRLHSRTRVLT